MVWCRRTTFPFSINNMKTPGLQAIILKGIGFGIIRNFIHTTQKYFILFNFDILETLYIFLDYIFTGMLLWEGLEHSA